MQPLLGRDRELAHLTEQIGVGAEPRSRSLLLAGDAGVGKTRLLAELVDRAEVAGWRTVVGHCLDFGDSALPYLPVHRGVRPAAPATDPEDSSPAGSPPHPALAHLQPGRRLLSGTTGGGRPSRPRPRRPVRRPVHAALEELGRAAARCWSWSRTPHWADRSTRDLLSFLFARRLPTARSPIVVSYRSDDLHRRHPLRATVAEWARLPGVARLQLDPLTDDDVAPAGAAACTRRRCARATVHAHRRARRGQRVLHRGARRRRRARHPTAPSPTTSPTCCWSGSTSSTTSPGRRPGGRPCAGRRVSHRLLARVVDQPDDRLDRVAARPPSSRTSWSGGRATPTPSGTPCSRRRSTTTCCPASGSGCTRRTSQRSATTGSTAPRPSWPGTPGRPTTCRPRCAPASRPATRRWRSAAPTRPPSTTRPRSRCSPSGPDEHRRRPGRPWSRGPPTRSSPPGTPDRRPQARSPTSCAHLAADASAEDRARLLMAMADAAMLADTADGALEDGRRGARRCCPTSPDRAARQGARRARPGPSPRRAATTRPRSSPPRRWRSPRSSTWPASSPTRPPRWPASTSAPATRRRPSAALEADRSRRRARPATCTAEMRGTALLGSLQPRARRPRRGAGGVPRRRRATRPRPPAGRGRPTASTPGCWTA